MTTQSQTNTEYTLGLVARDSQKQALSSWVCRHQQLLSSATIFATGTTGSILKEACPQLNINCLKSGPLGGDQQLGAMICEGRLSTLIFLSTHCPPTLTMLM